VLAPAGTSFSRVVVYAGPGNDDGTVAGSITLPAWLYGGDGNDRLKGGNGNNVLVAIHWPARMFKPATAADRIKGGIE